MRGIAIAAALLVATSASAGDWQPNPNEKHYLLAPSESPAPATESEDRWVTSLLENLRRGRAKPDFVHRFARSSARYTINGEPQDGTVFVYRENPRVFLILNRGHPWADFVVNFEEAFVDAPGWGTIYVPPSRSFCVVVFDHASSLRGIPVTGAPGNPSFTGHEVSWH
jgi:hypothetical protein